MFHPLFHRPSATECLLDFHSARCTLLRKSGTQYSASYRNETDIVRLREGGGTAARTTFPVQRSLPGLRAERPPALAGLARCPDPVRVHRAVTTISFSSGSSSQYTSRW